jgi:hypothetical protein
MSVLPRPTLPLTVEAMQAVRNAFPEDFQCAITVGELVKAGFRYLGPKDTVMCPYCALGLRNWQPEDKAIEQHRMRSPDCPMFLYEDNQEEDTGDGFTHLSVTMEEYGRLRPFM